MHSRQVDATQRFTTCEAACVLRLTLHTEKLAINDTLAQMAVHTLLREFLPTRKDS